MGKERGGRTERDETEGRCIGGKGAEALPRSKLVYRSSKIGGWFWWESQIRFVSAFGVLEFMPPASRSFLFVFKYEH